MRSTAALTGKTQTRKRTIDIRKTMLPYMYLVPAFAVMAVITFYPLIYQIIVSFTDFQTKDLRYGLASPQLHYIGLKNYIDILTGGLPVQNFEFFRVLIYNFWWAITNVMVHVPAGVVIAVLLNTPAPDPTYIVAGVVGSNTTEDTPAPDKGTFTRLHVLPPSVDR